MTQRAVRANADASKNKRKMSRYETALEQAFKQKRVYAMALDEVSTLDYIPDTVTLPDGDNSGSPTLTLPGGYFDEDKEVTVINKDAAESVAVGTSGSEVTCPAASKTVLYFNGTAWALLYTQTGVTTT